MTTLQNFKSNPIIAILIANLINDGGSAEFASITATVPVKMNKTGNLFYGRVTRQGKYFITLNANYQNAVNNQLKREGKEADFVAQKPWWTKVFDGFNGSIAYKTSDPSMFYLVYLNRGYEFMGYFVDGRPALPREIANFTHFIPEKSEPKNQGTDKAIYPQAIHVENIDELTANGYTFQFKGIK